MGTFPYVPLFHSMTVIEISPECLGFRTERNAHMAAMESRPTVESRTAVSIRATLRRAGRIVIRRELLVGKTASRFLF